MTLTREQARAAVAALATITSAAGLHREDVDPDSADSIRVATRYARRNARLGLTKVTVAEVTAAQRVLKRVTWT